MGLSKLKNVWNLCRVGTRIKNQKVIERRNKKKLHAIVKYAYNHSDFYRSLYDNHNIDINNFEIEQLPIITKEDILRNYDLILTDKKVSKSIIEEYVHKKEKRLLRGKYGVFSSGGSSGIRCHIPYDEKSMYILNALTILRSGLIKPKFKQRISFLGGVNHTNNTKNLEKNGFLKSQFKIDTVPLFLSEEEVITRLNSFKPTTVAAYSYMLKNLAIKKLNGELSISPNRMRCGGTPLSQNDREIIKKAFGVVPYENYGASESLLIASECRCHNGMHINEDCYIIEFYKSNKVGNKMQAEGILLTNPHNKLFPLIRYKLDDQVVYSTDKCACGSSFRRIIEIRGREAEYFKFGANSISPIKILNRINEVAIINECRLVQHKENQIEIRVVCSSHTDYHIVAVELYDCVKKMLNKFCSGEILITIGFYEELVKDEMSGKLVPFITMNKWEYLNEKIDEKCIYSYSV